MAIVNRLSAETSPYLLEHARNPVWWQPWDEEALALAESEGKPILLSIGYSACHWCHVMARESFEDPETAALMNRSFVNIKVDREERPDIDQLYQTALAEMGEQRGWPLTLFLTPEGKPFAGGTYFPPQPAYGRPAFRDLLRTLAEAYEAAPDEAAKKAGDLTERLAHSAAGAAGAQISITQMNHIATRLAEGVDPVYGGFGRGLKFPHPMALETIWRAYLRTGHSSFRDPVLLSLEQMCMGGLYDHLGGGFHRYAVDEFWLVPHFEKMLYDNALLIDLMTLTWREQRSGWLARRIEESVAFLLRDMRVEGGAFGSALAADSAGHGNVPAGEGAYYVWQEAEIDSLLGGEAATFKTVYDVTPGGNWEGVSVLNRSERPDGDEEAALARFRATLFAARQERPAPALDQKVLADWNGLAVSALANAACVFGREDWLAAARRAFDFVRERLGEGDRLCHSYAQGRPSALALLDDYAQMARAALSLLEAGGDLALVKQAEAWVAQLERDFWDAEGGGYFTSEALAGQSALRSKTAQETATPAGNGTMVGVLARLHGLTGNEHYRRQAEATVTAFSGALSAHFFALASLVNASELLQDLVQIVLVGEADDALAAIVYRDPLARRLLVRLPEGSSLPADHPASGKTPVGGRAAAYVCVGTACRLPITDPDQLSQTLSELR